MMYRSLFLSTFIIVLSYHATLAQPRNQWEHYFRGPASETSYLRDVYKLENDFALTGSTRGRDEFGNSFTQFWLIIADENGDETNQHVYRPQEWRLGESYSIIQCDDGGFLMGGTQDINRVEHFTVIRTDDERDMSWNMVIDEDSRCYAVIELKDGDYIGCGRITLNERYFCYAVKFNDEGEVIWDENYDGLRFWAVREVDNGYMFAGHRGAMSLIVRTDENGEVVWEDNYNGGSLRDLVSCRNGGFAAVGGGNGGPYLLRINGNGDRVWDHHYNLGWEATGLAELPDGNFIVTGSSSGAHLMQVDAEGNRVWNRNDNGPDQRRQYHSIIAGEDGFAWAAGYSRGSGYLVKVLPIRSAPVVTDFTPENLDFRLLNGDSLIFSVFAIDWQEDSLSYLWTQNHDTVSADTSITITFDELGTDTIDCTVSDGELADSIRWIIHVEELYIDSYSHQTLTIPTRRNSTIDFAVTARAVADDPVEHQWLLNDEQIADDDSVSILFERGREHSVTAVASQGELSDSVSWQVMVNDLIVDYMPEQFELFVQADTTFEFEVFPFDENDDSLQFLWTLDGDSVGSRSWLLRNFDEEGMYNVTAYVSDTTESDSLTWEVNVEANSIHADEPRHPDTTTLQAPVPNPFNSRTRIRYQLPTKAWIDLGLYDISGRRVETLYSGVRAAGVWSATLDGSELSSGVYFVGMSVGEQRLLQKVVLVK